MECGGRKVSVGLPYGATRYLFSNQIYRSLEAEAEAEESEESEGSEVYYEDKVATQRDRQDELTSVDDSKSGHKCDDESNAEEVEPTGEKTQPTLRSFKRMLPHADFELNALKIDLENLKPKLLPEIDDKSFPVTCNLEYKGHKGAVLSISSDASGLWIASGSADGTVRIWEVESGRCLRVLEIGEAVQYVAWNPLPELPVLAISAGQDVIILNTELGNEEEQRRVKELLHVETPTAPDDNMAFTVSWLQDDKFGGIRVRHFKTVSSIEWHCSGDYFSVVIPTGESRAIIMHQFSKKLSKRIRFKLHRNLVSSAFHPSGSFFFIATKKNIRVYDLLEQKLIRKLETGLKELTSIAIHPAGDHVIVGSREGNLCWFDVGRSSKPHRVLMCHLKNITRVAFHRSYPLFASSSDDCTAYVLRGMVHSDLNQDPLIMPLLSLRGHMRSKGRGVMDCMFHPRQPWLFTAGADSVIRLYRQ